MTTTNQHLASSIVTASSNETLSPIEGALMDVCNELHDARERRDTDTIDDLSRVASALLDRYDATDAEDHPNSAWARPNQRALVLSAQGRVEDAIRAELVALKYADTPRRREISCGNIADRMIRMGDFAQSIQYFLDAIDERPDSVPVLLVGAVAMLHAGELDHADTILRTLGQNTTDIDLNSELALTLRFDARVRDAALALPSGRDLLNRLDAAETQA